MVRNVLIFRTDRIGDLIVTCPAIITIKKKVTNSKITLISSSKNYDYAKSLGIFDEILIFPRKGLINKINFINSLKKRFFDYIFVFDGKERSIITTIFLKSKYKVALTSKKINFYKFFKIKFFHDSEGVSLNEIFQKALNFSLSNSPIGNYNFLELKKDNNFSKQININKYIHIHLDEKWFSENYIKKYTNINPAYDEFVDFINIISEKRDLLITTGLTDFILLSELINKFFEKHTDKIFLKKNYEKSIYLIYKPTFEDIESLLRNSEILIACHGAITHASNSFSVKKIDIIEKQKENFYNKFNSYLDDYQFVYRSNFSNLKKILLKRIN